MSTDCLRNVVFKSAITKHFEGVGIWGDAGREKVGVSIIRGFAIKYSNLPQ